MSVNLRQILNERNRLVHRTSVHLTTHPDHWWYIEQSAPYISFRLISRNHNVSPEFMSHFLAQINAILKDIQFGEILELTAHAKHLMEDAARKCQEIADSCLPKSIEN